eukprot:CAMPEP_0202483466 /NCGR_PEP_ID=MMETSP1361-20130828/2707_1 /ASSEMBLY_ACC=CAM_ASM_000849 /TAXON_ID=210615 /ORGANISM="Staurosira complex sp., Strain CCMP2646" /LENGTH=265 /DNA_ID=CAMNT_0049111743 /DNA_START=1635 /DNA_END=2432 /DNA_ORIENTATION=-
MPHGKVKTLFPLITLTIAATVCLIGLFNCNFVQTDVLIVDGWNGPRERNVVAPPPRPPIDYNYTATVRAGFWPNCGASGDRGAIVRDFQDDPARKVAMSFGLVACIIGIAAMAALWPITCKPFSEMWIRILGSAVVLAFVSQLITFAMFGTEICKENGCSLAWGGVFSIIAAVLFLISAVTIWKIPEPSREVVATAGADHSIQVNETELPDGTMVMEKTTINSDGTQTIEKTIIMPTDSGGGIEKHRDTGDSSADDRNAVAETEV